MLLIADSGSTKTDWRLIKANDEIIPFETIGFNPYFINSKNILNELNKSELKTLHAEVTQVFFYGAGCSTKEKNKIILNPLTTFFYNAKIEVAHDMLAAVRATCRNNEGMVAILGTGSNSCLYNGSEIVENIAALGYILGDYGSGADLGKTFIKAFLNHELPKGLMDDFKKENKLSLSKILDAVYHQSLPNRFLAGFSLFIHYHIKNPIVKEMVMNRFDLFFNKNICKYTDYQYLPLHLVGSIAANYQDVIAEVAEKYQVTIGTVIKKPINELVAYHLK